jgi:cellobiose dehydrogenase (acceptor)
MIFQSTLSWTTIFALCYCTQTSLFPPHGLLNCLVFRVNAATTQACDSGSGVCVAFSIPTTAQTTSDTADILVAVQAPGSLGWVGMGFGQQMVGSLVFVMWPNNNNVVVSPRYAMYTPQPPL